MTDIITDAAILFHFRREDILGPRRFPMLVRARRAVIHVLMSRGGMSRSAVGRMLGGRDHSTISHAMAEAEKLIRTDPDFAAAVGQLMTGKIPERPETKRYPAILTKRVKPKNELALQDTDARMRMHGTFALLRAIEDARAA